MKSKSFLYFGLGALVGSVITFFVTKSLMDKEYSEREKGVENLFERKRKELEDRCAKLEEATVPDTPVSEVSNDGTESPNEENKEEPMTQASKHIDPHVIAMDEYGETGYDTKQVYLYSDGIITVGDDTKIDIHEAYSLLGKDNFRDLAVSEEPAIYIRNDDELTDYRVESLSYDYYSDETDEE